MTQTLLSYGLGSTCTHSYASFEKPALPKPSQESTAELWGSEARKEKPWDCYGSRTVPVFHRRHTWLCFPQDSKSRVCRPQNGWVLKWQDAMTSLETNMGSAFIPLQKKWLS